MNFEFQTMKAAKITADDGEDRLSTLPDSVLCDILSFLPMKHAAATSILSRRWRDIFLSVPNIDLDDSLLFHPPKEEDKETSSKILGENFASFVRRLLKLSEPNSIREFRLRSKLSEGSIVELWVTSVLCRNIQVLDICIDGENGFEVFLPSEIFVCKTLVVLKLRGLCVLNVPELVNFPNLKVLHLESIIVFGEHTDWIISEGYPLLEDLQMRDITFHDLVALYVSVPSLKKLAMVGMQWDLDKIVISTPELEHLDYNGSIKLQCSAFNFKSLVTADLCVIPLQDNFLLECSYWFTTLICELVTVKSLRLLGSCSEGFFLDHALPKFLMLTHMELEPASDYQWRILIPVLRCVPNLEVLVWDLAKCSVSQVGVGHYVSKSTSLALPHQHLREVQIKNFRGRDFEFELVRCLLLNGAVLERIIIGISEHEKTEKWPTWVSKRFFKFSRCSKSCEIVVT